MNYKSIALSVFSVILFSCATGGELQLADADSAAAKELVARITNYNTSLPDTIKADMDVKIHAYSKTIKARADLYYRKDLGKWKLTLKDPVFNTILFHLLVEGDTVYAYSPIEKTMLIKKSDPSASSFIDFEQNPAVLYILASNRLPLIPGGKVKSFAAEKDGGKNRYIELENAGHLERITFEDKTVSRIVMKEKTGGKEIEINYTDPASVKGYDYFKVLAAVSGDGNSKLYITYRSVKINTPIADMSIFKITPAPDTKVFR